MAPRVPVLSPAAVDCRAAAIASGGDAPSRLTRVRPTTLHATYFDEQTVSGGEVQGQMSVISRGFGGNRPASDPRIPPGQYRTDDFPVLTAGPTPLIDTADWLFEVTSVEGTRHALSWGQLMDLPNEQVTVDIHCVTKWSKLGTRWRGVPVSTVLAAAGVEVSDGPYVLIHSYGGYTTNLPMNDLVDGKAWVAFEFEGQRLAPEHGGPARLLVPHLYFWKSAKWVNGLELRRHDQPGFWENFGYHSYGDPWREQRYDGD